MKALAGKLVNHGTYPSLGEKLQRAAEFAGTLHTLYNVGKTVLPYAVWRATRGLLGPELR